MITRTRADHQQRDIPLRRDARDQRLRPVTTGHPEQIRAPIGRIPHQRPDIDISRAVQQRDLGAQLLGLARQIELDDLPPTRPRIHHDERMRRRRRRNRRHPPLIGMPQGVPAGRTTDEEQHHARTGPQRSARPEESDDDGDDGEHGNAGDPPWRTPRRARNQKPPARNRPAPTMTQTGPTAAQQRPRRQQARKPGHDRREGTALGPPFAGPRAVAGHHLSSRDQRPCSGRPPRIGFGGRSASPQRSSLPAPCCGCEPGSVRRPTGYPSPCFLGRTHRPA